MLNGRTLGRIYLTAVGLTGLGYLAVLVDMAATRGSDGQVAAGIAVLSLIAFLAIFGRTARYRSLTRLRAVQAAHPKSLVLPCQTPQEFLAAVNRPGMPGVRAAPRLASSGVAVVFTATEIVIWGGTSHPRPLRSLPRTIVTDVSTGLARSGRARWVPSVILHVEARSERLTLPLQIVDWSNPFVPRFGPTARIETAAQRISQALSTPTS